MNDARKLWGLWQELLAGFRACFTRPGQELVSVGLEDRWRVMEAFAERGALDRDRVERQLDGVVRETCGLWHGYEVSATDDTKLHRTSEHVWGVCTFQEYTSRCPNRAETVRAHNWVTRGRLVPANRGGTCPWVGDCILGRANSQPGRRFGRNRRWPWRWHRLMPGRHRGRVWGLLTGDTPFRRWCGRC